MKWKTRTIGVGDHFLSLCPTTLTVDLLEERLLAAETSITAVGASRDDPRTPFFEGCSPVPLLPSVASAAPVDLVGTESVSAASAPSERRRISKAKRGKGAGGGSGGGGSGGGGGGGVGVGVVAEVGASVAAVELEAAVAVEGGVAEAEAAAAEVEPAEAELSSEDPILRTGDRTGEQCGGLHATQRCFGRLTDAWCAQFPDATEIPRWHDLLRSGVAIFDLDFDAILAAMYAVSISAEGVCYVCVLPDPGIEAAALGASESAAPGAGESAISGTASAQVVHTFTLNSGASRSFFRDRTTFTPLSRPVAVSLADPSGGPILARYSTILPCPAAPSGSLSGLYLPSFSTNLVSGADLQDAGVDQFTLAGQRVTHCTCAQTGRHLATFTRRPGSSLYTLTTESPPVTTSGQVAALSQAWPLVSLSLVSPGPFLPFPRGLPLPAFPASRGGSSPLLTPPSFPPTEAPLQTLHMDVWGPARVRGQGHECYFLLMVDDYSHYTTVFPLRSKGEVTEVLIDWIRAARLQLSESFGSDFPVLHLHSDRGGEISSDLLRAFCRAEGIRQTFTLPASPQQNGIAERRIGMVMDVARTSMIHAAAPHFLWPFAVQYAAHQINLQPRVSLPETSPTLRRTGKVPYYRLFPYRTAPLPPPPLFLAPGPPPVDPLPPQGPAPSGVSQVDAVEHVKVAVDSGASRGAEPGCAESGGAGSGGAEPGGAEPGGAGSGGAEPGGAEPGGAGSGGAETERAESGGADPGAARSGGVEPAGAGPGGHLGALSRRELPSPQELREWFARLWSRAAGAGGAASAGVSSAIGGTGAGGTTGAGPGGSTSAGGVGATGSGGARTGGTGAAGPAGAPGAGAGGATGVGATEGPGAVAAVSAGGPAGAGAAGGSGAGGSAGVGADARSVGVVPAGSRGATRPASPVRTARTSPRVPRPLPPAVPGMHQMTLRPSTAPQRVPLPRRELGG
ncbi:unnamed protein product [Closterium sp. NIES-53]